MEKRKFLFASLTGLIGDIAWQVVKEGHDVRYYINDEKEQDIADGFVPKSKDWEKDAKRRKLNGKTNGAIANGNLLNGHGPTRAGVRKTSSAKQPISAKTAAKQAGNQRAAVN